MKNISIENKKFFLLFIISLIFSIVFSFVLSRQPGVLTSSDHFSLWYSVNKLVTEQRSIYDPQNGEEVVALNPRPVNPIEGGFYYPAHLMIFFLPFARLPYPIAHFIWIIIVQLFVVIGLFLLYKDTHYPPSVNRFSVFVLLSLFFIPYLQNTIWGQYNTIGILFLTMVYMALRREKYFLAGLLAIGLTFKPQNYLLPLVFLLLWALLIKKRWNFMLGFSVSCLGFGLLAEYFEPHWIASFLQGIKIYNNFHHELAVLDYNQWYFALLCLLLIGLWLWCFIKNYRSEPVSAPFTGCFVLSFGIWWLIVPVSGMMHLAALPIILMMLFPFLQQPYPKFYKWGQIGFLLLYGLGFAGFIYGLSTPGAYGMHIELAELAYKIAMPILTIALTIPLCLSKPPFWNKEFSHDQ